MRACDTVINMYDGEIDEAYDEPRQSLLDLVQQRMAEIGKTVMISRLVYVARPVDLHSNTKEITDFHEILIDEAVGDSSEKCTGLLLCYPNVSLHVIEAPHAILIALLHCLGERAAGLDVIDAVKILSFTDDVPFRAFKDWHTAFIGGTEEVHDSYEPAEKDTVVPLASEVNLTFLKVARRMSDMAPAAVDAALQSPALAFPELPSIKTLQSLLLATGVPSSKEFLEIFDATLDVNLDSERVWPVPESSK